MLLRSEDFWNRAQALARNTRRAFWAFVATAMTVLLVPGCGGSSEQHLEDYLEELEFDKPLEEVRAVALGKYRIPIATLSHESAKQSLPATWVRAKFQLIVYVTPEDEMSVSNAMERHRGMLDDVVLTTCRTTTMDDLQDPRLATLKFRLTDIVQPILGEGKVRRVLINDFVLEAI